VVWNGGHAPYLDLRTRDTIGGSNIVQARELIFRVQPLSAWSGMQITRGVPVQILSQITKRLSAFTSPDTSASLDSILSLWR